MNVHVDIRTWSIMRHAGLIVVQRILGADYFELMKALTVALQTRLPTLLYVLCHVSRPMETVTLMQYCLITAVVVL